MKSMNIYMDYAASAEPNPSSIHSLGLQAKGKLNEARAKVAKVLSARPEEIIFTSGGTEANNLAIQGIVYSWHADNKQDKKLPHLVTTNIEHPSVLETFKLLKKRNLAEISIVPVEVNGIVDPKKIKKELKKNTILVSVMYANNEIGTIQPLKEIAKEIRHFRKTKQATFPFFHTDAVQAVNYFDLNVEKLGVDMLTLSGSKISGSGRVGVLYKKKIIKLENIFGGGDQELGLRPGTENLEAILKFATALDFTQKFREKEFKRLVLLRSYFLKHLEHYNIINNVIMLINGDLEERLPNNVNITFPKIPSDLLVIELSARGVMVSSKSACKSSRSEGSYVIEALRPASDSEIGGLRFSFGRETTKQEINYVIKSLSEILQKLKKWYD